MVIQWLIWTVKWNNGIVKQYTSQAATMGTNFWGLNFDKHKEWDGALLTSTVSNIQTPVLDDFMTLYMTHYVLINSILHLLHFSY